MNVVINAVLAHEQPRGVGRYLNNLLPALAECDKRNRYYIYYGKWMNNYHFLKIRQDNFQFIELDICNNKLARNLYLSIVLPLHCKRYSPDVFFLIDTQLIILKPCKIVSTVHDLAEFEMSEKYPLWQAKIRQIIVRHQVKVSSYVITVSEYSKNDICQRLKKRSDDIYVTYEAVDAQNIRQTNTIDNYFLFVGEIERAKNLLALVQAFSMLSEEKRSRFSIKVVGKKGNDYQNIVKNIEQLQIADKVEFYGYVSDETLNELYAKAYAFVFPSLFEGFGLPVLEAMSRGIPVLCSNSSSIPEVGGDAVLTFDPYHAEELSKKMSLIIDDKSMRERMVHAGLERAKQFSSEKMAAETLKVLSKVLENEE